MNKEANDIVTARLLNWGLWSNVNCYPHLGYTAFVEIMKDYFPQATRINPNDKDAMHIEYILSSLDMGARKGIGWGDVYAFVCRLEYVEFERPRSAKAEHVKFKYKRPCGDRTYRRYLNKAKESIHILANPL